ncbi:MAG: spore maturation protein A [Oscillibacter sp.]|nr:spore maturation protein A [Oscillibacter sp.]
MAMSVIWTGLVTFAWICGLLTGRAEAVAAAALDGAAEAVTLCLSMLGALMLWNGVMELLRAAGLAAGLSRMFQPLLRRLFPEAGRDAETLSALTANVTANLLGLGNAATPFGIRAAERMSRTCHGAASDELCRLVVLNTASIQLFPATVASLRSAAGCRTPLDILPAVWVTSAASVAVGLCAEYLLSRTGDRAL